jgi:hypothetical protein
VAARQVHLAVGVAGPGIARLGVFGREDGDHPIDMIAVDGVDPHAKQIPEQRFVLEIPSESGPAEPVEQGDEAAVPIAVVKIDAVDFRLGESGSSTFGSLGDLLEACAVDQAHISIETT